MSYCTIMVLVSLCWNQDFNKPFLKMFYEDYDRCDVYNDDQDFYDARYSSDEYDPREVEEEGEGEAKLIPTYENGFTIDGDIKTQDELQKLIIEHKRANQTKRNTKEVTTKFAALFNDRSSADIVLSVNGTPYHAHRLILCSWSTVFCKMLEDSEWFASSLTTDEVSDCDTLHLVESKEDAHIFNEFLKFMYTERATINIEDIWQMVSLANKYNVVEILNSCSEFLIQFVHTIPIDEELMEIMKVAEFWAMGDLQSTIWQIILHNMYFSLQNSLPTLGIDYLCKVLQSSDFLVENEYRLLLKLTPLIRQLVEANDEETLQKVIDLIRFTEMSGTQLQKVMQLDVAKYVRSHVQQALFHRCFLWESEDGIAESKGPRCYLSLSPPYFDIKNNILDDSVTLRNDEDWTRSDIFALEKDQDSFEQSIGSRFKCFIYHTEKKRLWLVCDTSVHKICGIVRGDQITIGVESITEPRKTLEGAIEGVATVTAVIHNKVDDGIQAVNATKVPVEVDLGRGFIRFKQTFWISLSCVRSSESNRHLSFFVMVRL